MYLAHAKYGDVRLRGDVLTPDQLERISLAAMFDPREMVESMQIVEVVLATWRVMHDPALLRFPGGRLLKWR